MVFFFGLVSGTIIAKSEQKEVGKTESKKEYNIKPKTNSCEAECLDKFKDYKCSCKAGRGDDRNCNKLCDCLHKCPR
jgi:hypothetical protein